MRLRRCLLLVAGLLALSAAGPVSSAGAQPAERVEAQAIDCGLSRLVVPGAANCRISSRSYNAYQRPRVWYEDSLPGAACVHEQGSATISGSLHFGFARYVMVPPGSHFHCIVGGWHSVNLQKIRSIGPLTRAAPDVAYPQQSGGDRFVSEFRSADGAACRAFVFLGPQVPVRRGHGDGRQYQILGYLCARGGAALTDADFDSYVGSIRIRTG